MSDRAAVPLGDLLRVKHGFAFAGSGFGVDADRPQLVTPGNFAVGGGFQSSRVKSFEGEFPSSYVLNPGDLVITMTDLSKAGDTLGLPAIIPSGQVYLHNQRVGLVQIKDHDRVSSRFLNFYLRTDAYRSYILGTASGSTVRHTSPGRIESFVALIPDISEQQAIAEVLGALDDKIAANTVKSRTASTLGMTYFSSLLDSAEDVHRSLGDFTTIVLGGTPARDVPEYWLHGQVPWLNSGEANLDRILYPSDHITKLGLAKSASKMMPIGATLVAITGATLGQIARLEINACGNQSLIGIWAQDEATTNWVHFAVRSEISELLKKATGAAQQHVNKADVERMQIPMVSLEKRQSFNLLIGPLLKVAAEADRESAQLAATRDALLPQLMSGKLRVRDAETAVEAVV